MKFLNNLTTETEREIIKRHSHPDPHCFLACTCGCQGDAGTGAKARSRGKNLVFNNEMLHYSSA